MENECVCDIVRRIVVAQNKVNQDNDCCTTSCDHSIDKLLDPWGGAKSMHTTIPIMLYCKSNCDPFVGKGMKKMEDDCSNGSFYPVESYVFRAKDFVEGSYCCAILEILVPYYENNGYCPSKQKVYTNKTYASKSCTPYDKWKNEHKKKGIKNFIATGVCLTVDLNKFIGVNCLEPITPIER
ncbi:hypothetical protein CAI16_19490 [Virgibacillus dokdonensis]|uniref:Spore coat protein n=2 Tax=Virgibacillus dokdonensis TaxID=302167 RepID=A0A3E0WJ16_9BACI|nr:hypothetical protein CAI16_19490 [Virgibacillus dokdonensis]